MNKYVFELHETIEQFFDDSNNSLILEQIINNISTYKTI